MTAYQTITSKDAGQVRRSAPKETAGVKKSKKGMEKNVNTAHSLSGLLLAGVDLVNSCTFYTSNAFYIHQGSDPGLQSMFLNFNNAFYPDSK